MEHIELLQWTLEYISGDWWRKNAYVDQPIVQTANLDMQDILRQQYPPQKRGITLEQLSLGREELIDKQALDRVNDNIPDTGDAQVLDLCSGTGIRFSYGFAKRHPHTRIVLLDKLTPQHFGTGMYTPTFEKTLRDMGKPEEEVKYLVHGGGFERYETPVEHSNNLAETMDRIIEANNAPNMVYAHHYLDSQTPLKTFMLPGKTTYLTGWDCESPVAVQALHQAAAHGIESIAMTIAGLEHLKRDTPFSEQVASMNGREWKALIERANAKPYHGPENQPFKYNKPEEKRLGFALKHARVLDILIWMEEQGYQADFAILNTTTKRNYNLREHFISAYKQKNLLALPEQQQMSA